MSGYPYRIRTRRDLPERLQGAPIVYGHPGHLVAIYCNEPPHENEVWLVTAFQLSSDADGGEARWTMMSAYPMQGNVLVSTVRHGDASLIGDEPTKDALSSVTFARIGDSAAYVPTAEWRKRYKLECRLCGLARPVRSDRLQVVLSRLDDTGVREVSLRAIVAIL